MTTTDPDDDRALDGLLTEARSQRPVPPADLMARVLADARLLSDARVPAAVPRRSADPTRHRWLRVASDPLGGWGAVAGLAAATVIGIGLGIVQPDALSGVTGAIWTEAVSATSGLDDDPLTILGG